MNNTDTIAVNFFEEHNDYVETNGLKALTPECQRIYNRGEEIINELLDDVIIG